MLTLGFTLHDKASPRLIRLCICIHVHVADLFWRVGGGLGGGGRKHTREVIYSPPIKRNKIPHC